MKQKSIRLGALLLGLAGLFLSAVGAYYLLRWALPYTWSVIKLYAGAVGFIAGVGAITASVIAALRLLRFGSRKPKCVTPGEVSEESHPFSVVSA